MATPAAAVPTSAVPAPFSGGDLLFIGGTDWQMVGRVISNLLLKDLISHLDRSQIGRSAPKGKAKDPKVRTIGESIDLSRSDDSFKAPPIHPIQWVQTARRRMKSVQSSSPT